MSKLLKRIQNETQSLYRKQIQETKHLVNKWNKLGLLEGIESNNERHAMAIMLENEAKHLLKEISKTGGQGSEEWSGVALPLVRRIFSEIAAKNFISIQPMTLPSGLVFYLDFKYVSDQPGFNTEDGPSGQANSVYGITNQVGAPTEGLYGSGRFGYSINPYTTTPAAAVATGSVSAADVNFNSDLASVSGSLSKVTVDMTGTSYDTLGTSAFEISGSNITSYYPEYTESVDELGVQSSTKVTFVVAGTADGDLGVTYHKQPTSSTRGDFEAQGDPSWGKGNREELTSIADVGANDLNIPELKIDIRQEEIAAKTRKLKAVWTPEVAEDLDAYHSIDAEAEVTSIMSEYISMEIDMELLRMIYDAALTEDVWSAQVGKVWTGSGFTTQDVEQGRALSYTQPSWFQTIGTKMQGMSNKIHQKVIRGGANFAVVSPDVATVIESIPGFNTDGEGVELGTESFAMGVQKVGAINKRFEIYKNPYWKNNVVLMGYRGNQFLETGAVYSPYIPLMMTPTILDPDNFTPRRGLHTRYAKKVTRAEYYGKIFVADLNLV